MSIYWLVAAYVPVAVIGWLSWRDYRRLTRINREDKK